MTEPLAVDDLAVDYLTGGRRVRALDGADLTVAGGETVGVVGESGSGKSTLGPPRDRALARAEAAYDRQREQLHAIALAMHTLVRRVTHEVRGGDEPDGGALAGWARSLARLRAALESSAGPPAPTVIDLCAHLMCNRLGVSVHEESHLRHLATRALVEVTGTDADAG